MNRVIKFRVWCKRTRHFTENVNLSASGGQLLWLHTGNKISISNLDEGDYVTQQFTGEKDKDGRDIYEGDVLKHLGEVVFRSGKFGFEGGENKWFDLSDADWRTKEVVGNIFQNSDLLKHE